MYPGGGYSGEPSWASETVYDGAIAGLVDFRSHTRSQRTARGSPREVRESSAIKVDNSCIEYLNVE